MRRAQEVRDVVHRLGGERGQRLGLDLTKRRPPASKVDTPSLVSSRYSVSSGAEREHVLVRELSHGSTVPQLGCGRAGSPVGSVGRMRIEHDSMGEVEVPDDARWAAQTQRAVDNFPISGEPIDRRLIAALAAIKGASATVNGRLGVIEKTIAGAIHDAAADVCARRLRRALPDRRVPDRIGHVVEHEHERGARIARL